ncbi:MAG: Gfo/Idh/MocA family oxidoreductase [Burkholderiaceae bacterium]|nr:Gfo/Idh/MocA family oxidoreductase [Microbacteriaceae bacterium]
MTARLTAVVVGAGAGGTLSIDALIDSDRFDLVGVADQSAPSRDRVAARTGVPVYDSLERMLAERPAEIVCISTWAPTHLPLTRLAAATPGVRGLLVEKPLGDTTAAGREILDLLRARDLPVVVPHGLMATAAALEIIARVHAGTIGGLRLVELESPRWDIINAGIHWLQFFDALVRSPVDTVLAATDTTTRTYRDGMQVETEAITLARTASGVRLLLNSGDDIPVPPDDAGTVCLMRIIGSHGIIEYRAFENAFVLMASGYDRAVVTVPPFAVSGHRRHLEHLADQVESGERDDANPESSLRALGIVEAAYLSARTGASVRPGAAPDQRDADRGVAEPWDPGAPYWGTGGGRNGRELDGPSS